MYLVCRYIKVLGRGDYHGHWTTGQSRSIPAAATIPGRPVSERSGRPPPPPAAVRAVASRQQWTCRATEAQLAPALPSVTEAPVTRARSVNPGRRAPVRYGRHCCSAAGDANSRRARQRIHGQDLMGSNRVGMESKRLKLPGTKQAEAYHFCPCGLIPVSGRYL